MIILCRNAILILFSLAFILNLSCNGEERGDDRPKSPDTGTQGVFGQGQVATIVAPPTDDQTTGETRLTPGKLSEEQMQELLSDPFGIGVGFLDELEDVMKKFARGHKVDEASVPGGKRWRVALATPELKYLDKNTDQPNVFRLHGKIGETRKPLVEIGIIELDKSDEERIFLLLGGISDSSSVADIVSVLGPLPEKIRGNISDNYFVEYVFTIPHPGNSKRTSMFSVRFNISDAGEILSLVLKTS